MLELLRDASSLKVVITDEYGVPTNHDISGFLAVGQSADAFLKPLIEHLDVMAPQSAKTYVDRLSWMGAALKHFGFQTLPASDDEWQKLVLIIFRFFFTRTDSTATLRQRKIFWEQVSRLLAVAQEEGQIPVSVRLPTVPQKLDSVDISSYRPRLLGQRSAQVITAPPSELRHKLLTKMDLSKTEAQHLEKIRDDLSRNRQLLFKVLSGRWDMIKKNYEFGKRLLASVDWGELKARLEAGPQLSQGHCINTNGTVQEYWLHAEHPASFSHGIQGLANYLAMCRHVFGGYVAARQAKNSQVHGKQNVPEGCQVPKFDWQAAEELIFSLPDTPPNLGHVQVTLKGNDGRIHALNWMIGNLRQVDIAAICALLTMLNPKFTPDALMLAKVHNKHGKTYLEVDEDKEGGKATFSLEKKRAKAMTTEELDNLSLEIINTVNEMTEFHRSSLRDQKHPAAVLLFLFVNSYNRISYPSRMTMGMIRAALSGSSQTKSINDFYPELAENGLDTGMITLSVIRDTEGVLEWFRTGSLKAMARKLGNTKKVVIEHYLPKPLLDAFNTRLIRRFQNLWIAVAAANEDFLLEVTDCATLAELHGFLQEMLRVHPCTSSPLAGELHKRFAGMAAGATDGSGSVSEEQNGALSIAIGTNALTALYVYHRTAIDAGLTQEAMDAKDPVTGLAPRYFIDLAQMLLTVLPEHDRVEFQNVHKLALIKAEELATRLGWQRLMVARS